MLTWLPEAISAHARGFDAQFTRTTVVAGVIFVAAQAALAFVVLRYRARGRTESGPPLNPRLELVWTAATAVVFLGLLAMGGRIWAGVQFTSAPPEAETIEVGAKQFAWNFRYSGPDHRFGRTAPRLINDAAANPFGLDEKDPASRDDIVTASLRIPAGRPVRLLLNSRDVIHSFCVRELRIKQDLVPGMTIPLTLRADTPGTYEVPCSELCGLGHHQMRTVLIVMPPAAYDRWKQEQPH